MPYVSTLSVFLPSFTRSLAPGPSAQPATASAIVMPMNALCIAVSFFNTARDACLLVHQRKYPDRAAARHVLQLLAHPRNVDAADAGLNRHVLAAFVRESDGLRVDPGARLE